MPPLSRVGALARVCVLVVLALVAGLIVPAAASAQAAPPSGTATISGASREWGNGNGGQGPGAPVLLMDSSGTELAAAVTAADGSYSFPNLAAGTYKVRFRNWQTATTYWSSVTMYCDTGSGYGDCGPASGS